MWIVDLLVRGDVYPRVAGLLNNNVRVKHS